MSRGSWDQIANICWAIEKARELQKIYFCFIDYVKASDYVDQNKLWNILEEMGIPNHLTCLLRYLYASQETTVKNGHGTKDWFKIGKEVLQGCTLSPCLFNLYSEYIIWNAELDKLKAGIKIAGRNIILRYTDDTILMAESEEQLKSLMMKVKEEHEKDGLKFNFQNTNIMASGPISSVQFSRSVVSDFLRPHESQHARPPYPSPTPGVHSDSCPSSQWCHPAISSSVVPSPPAPNRSQHQSLFQWVNSSHEVAKVLEFQLPHFMANRMGKSENSARYHFFGLQKSLWIVTIVTKLKDACSLD